MNRLIRLINILVLLLTAAPFLAHAIDVGAPCSSEQINNAITDAATGSTIQLTCTGEVTWTSSVVIPASKGIILKGGGINTPKDKARFPLTIISDQTPAISLSVGPNHKLSRITGFKFKNSGTALDKGFINITGTGNGTNGLGAFRFDNNYLDQISGHAIITVFSDGGPLYGLIDNNTMADAFRADDPITGPYGIQVWNYLKDSNGCWGGNGWTDLFQYGTENFVFIEDNLFENKITNPIHYMRHYISAELGGRYVARYNTFDVQVARADGGKTDCLDAHGLCLCASNGAGSRGGEIYNNTFNGDKIGRPVLLRGGTWLVHDNLFSQVGSTGAPIWMLDYRAGDSKMYGQCSATCPCAEPWISQVTDTNGRYHKLPQQVTDTYIWHNKDGNNVDVVAKVDSAGVQQSYIQSTDYTVSNVLPTAISSYKSYDYPHPLRNGDSPSAPKNLRSK